MPQLAALILNVNVNESIILFIHFTFYPSNSSFRVNSYFPAMYTGQTVFLTKQKGESEGWNVIVREIITFRAVKFVVENKKKQLET